ncbi:MAG TPA: potassium-transporting ATPase subunit KdpA [bacterium]|jgi:K+-transporting ATPase ATPase A chain|nr:potassium-transporting ATPase subunit KdpA [bacterium]
MTSNQWLQIIAYFVVLLALSVPLGIYMAKVYENKPLFLGKFFGWLEKLIYKLGGIHPEKEMDWKGYALSMLLFNIVGGLILYAMERVQASLPLNPAGQSAVPPDLAFNTAISFITNTNWQFYGGETTMSYLTQMAGLAVHNFLCAASGMATLVALIRGIVRKETKFLGNFWVDMTRGVLYILLPLSVIFTMILIQQGTPQTFSNTVNASLVQPTSYDQPVTTAAGVPVTVDGKPQMTHVVVTEQPISLGPVASQEAIKMLGTNGGGYFNVNSAHPYENPTPFIDFLELLAILLIPAALCFTFGSMVKDHRQGWAILVAMFLLLAPMLYLCVQQEQAGNPLLNRMTVGAHGETLADGNMEGKEVRFGIADSALWASITTAASNGSVNAMHDSFTPLGGMVPMWMIMLGEVSFGGVGSGLYGMLAFVILAVFVAGLMVGRTPEYLGKKIQTYEMKMASIMILIPPLLVLVCTAVAVATGGAGTNNPGAHGFSELLYAFDSMSNNNGSAFAGLSATTLYNLMGGAAMWFGRFWLAIPVLAMAGSLAKKKVVPESAGTLPTHTVLFVVMLISTVIIVGALTFFPALALGPIVEHLKMIRM